jgi:hypothetical protein
MKAITIQNISKPDLMNRRPGILLVVVIVWGRPPVTKCDLPITVGQYNLSNYIILDLHKLVFLLYVFIILYCSMIVAVPVHWIHWADPADRQALNHWAPGKWMRIASGRLRQGQGSVRMS